MLKDLIPDYNPGSQLLKVALSGGVVHGNSNRPVAIPIAAPGEGPAPVQLAPAAQMS
jgi:hypothetical protein